MRVMKKAYIFTFVLQGDFWGFFMYSTLFHLQALRFHCVGGCWDRTQDSCDFGIGSQTTLKLLGLISSTSLLYFPIWRVGSYSLSTMSFGSGSGTCCGFQTYLSRLRFQNISVEQSFFVSLLHYRSEFCNYLELLENLLRLASFSASGSGSGQIHIPATYAPHQSTTKWLRPSCAARDYKDSPVWSLLPSSCYQFSGGSCLCM